MSMATFNPSIETNHVQTRAQSARLSQILARGATYDTAREIAREFLGARPTGDPVYLLYLPAVVRDKGNPFGFVDRGKSLSWIRDSPN